MKNQNKEYEMAIQDLENWIDRCEETIRNIAVLFDFDPSEGEGMTPEEIECTIRSKILNEGGFFISAAKA